MCRIAQGGQGGEGLKVTIAKEKAYTGTKQ